MREGFVVRVLRAGSVVPTGSGFMIEDWYVLTCAHVVNTALGQVQRDREAPGAEMQVQGVALAELWARQRRRRLTFADYHALGGVAGALDRYAEGVFAELAERGLGERVRRVMLALVRSREGAAQATRRVVGQDRLARDWDVVEELARRRLLMIGD